MLKQILQAGLIAGTCDITAACVQAYIISGATPDRVLKYVASGVFGKSAFSGGFDMVLCGLLFHFIIAMSCAACYFWLYPKLPFLKKSLLLNAVLIGIVAWIVTTRIIVPLSHVSPAPFNIGRALMAMCILIVCIGFPIAYFTDKYFKK